MISFNPTTLVRNTLLIAFSGFMLACGGQGETQSSFSSSFSSSLSSSLSSNHSTSSQQSESSSSLSASSDISSQSSSSQSSSSASSMGPVSPEPIPVAVGQSVVRFVYFIEQGQAYDAAVHQSIIDQAFAMQLYWYEQFGGTFYLYDQVVDVIFADFNDLWYVQQADGIHGDERWYRLGNIKNEVYGKLGINNFDPKVRVVNYPVVRHDGRVGANFGGAWMDGDDLSCLLGANNGYNFPYPDGTPAHCMGHVVHEFGHVYGLDHVGPDDDCMRWGLYIYETDGELCQFSQENRQTVVNNQANADFLVAYPGEVVTPQGTVEAR